MHWSVITAVNNDALLKNCLLSSPDIGAAREIVVQRGFNSAASAYNDGLQRASSEVVVFPHQDVYLPPGWVAAFDRAIKALFAMDPEWAVAGAYGVDRNGEHRGHVFCTGQMKELGEAFIQPQEVASLDELLLIVRRSSGVRFDEALDSYHMYGTDICLEANRLGKKAYAIPVYCLHNTNPYRLLPWDFWRAYLFMRAKWRLELPITTACTRITKFCGPMIRYNVRGFGNRLLNRDWTKGGRVPLPAQFWQEQVVR